MDSTNLSDYRRDVEKAMNGLRIQTDAHDRLWHIGEASWTLDQDTGKLVFQSQDGTSVEAAAQIIGTYNTLDGTWLWAWDHPSIEASLAIAARTVLEYGRISAVPELTTRKIKCTEDQCWEFTALACMLAKQSGAYRGP